VIVATCALVACSDVGDSSAIDTHAPPPSAAGDAATDATLGSTSPDGGPAEPSAPDASVSDAAPADVTVTDGNPSDTTVADTNAPDTNASDTNAPDTNVADTNAPDTNVPDTNAPDAEIADTSVPDGEIADTDAPDANVPDANLPDTNAPDAGGPVACTQSGQAGCVACSGNADGVCTPTEALFVAHDIAAGHAATVDCYACLMSSGCLDDTQFGDKNHECGDLSGTFGSGAAPALCLDTVSCILSTSCSASDVSICYCGPSHAGNACQTAANPDGQCKAQELAGLGVTDNATVLKDYTDTTRPSGMANQIFACAESNSCGACLQ
jgi:hypothetical protein